MKALYEVKYRPVLAACAIRGQEEKQGTGIITVNVVANDVEHAIAGVREQAVAGSPEPSEDTCEPSFKLANIIVTRSEYIAKVDLA